MNLNWVSKAFKNTQGGMTFVTIGTTPFELFLPPSSVQFWTASCAHQYKTHFQINTMVNVLLILSR